MLALFGVCSPRLRRRLWPLGVPMLSFVLVRIPAEAAQRVLRRLPLVRVLVVLPVLPLLMDARTSTIWIRWIRFLLRFAVAVPFLLLVRFRSIRPCNYSTSNHPGTYEYGTRTRFGKAETY